MPVIAIAFNRQFVRWKSIVNCIRWYRVLLNWRQTRCYQSIVQHKFDTADALLGLLSQNCITLSGASAEPFYQRRLYVANFAASLAFHFYFFFVQWVRFANESFSQMSFSACYRAAIGFVIRGASKLFSAMQAYLLQSWQATRRALVGFIGAGARAVFPVCIATFMLKGFAATSAYADRVLLSCFGLVAARKAFGTAILFCIARSCGKCLIAGWAKTNFDTPLPFISANCRAVLLAFIGRLILSAASRTYVHIAIVPQMRYYCNYE